MPKTNNNQNNYNTMLTTKHKNNKPNQYHNQLPTYQPKLTPIKTNFLPPIQYQPNLYNTNIIQPTPQKTYNQCHKYF